MEMIRYFEKDSVRVTQLLSFHIDNICFDIVKYKRGLSVINEGVQLCDYSGKLEDPNEVKRHFENSYKKSNMNISKLKKFREDVLKSHNGKHKAV